MKTPSAPDRGEPVETLGQFALMRRVFRRHQLAVVALRVLGILYFTALFAEFLAPNGPNERRIGYAYAPPSRLAAGRGLGLHVEGVGRRTDPVALRRYYVRDAANDAPLRFLVRGDPYRMWGLWDTDLHLFGARPTAAGVDEYGYPPQAWLPLGADKFGRCIASRLIYGARTSLSVGLLGVLVTLVLGIAIGGLSGYVGGKVDTLIQRVIEIVNALPPLPLWLALGAAVPSDWPPQKTYFAITVLLAFLSWTGLARVVRGKILSLREEDYAIAAKLLGASNRRILFRHLVPGFASHIVVSATLAVPGMILGETSLSFLGLGLKPPAISWGVMLQDCMDVKAVTEYPWLIAPVAAIMVAVLAFNFVGDGLRDAADPYSGR